MKRITLVWLLATVPLASHTVAAPRFRGVSALPGRPAIVLVAKDVEPAAVMVRKNAPAKEKQAATELARYLSQISGAEFGVRTADETLPERAILVGEVGLSPPRDVSAEGFLIQTDGQRLRICGGTPHATLFGVFALLEEQLGCRWWSCSEEDVPRRESIEVVAQDTHIEPAFQRHDVFNREAQNPRNSFAYKLRTVSLTNFTGGHNLCPILKPYAEEHTDFLPMDKDGQRKFNNIHMNYTAAGMDAVLADILRGEVEKRDGKLNGVIYFAGMGDWYGGMDLSPPSQRIYEEETWTDPDGRNKPGYSATLLRMINRTAESLEKDYPGIQVGTFAYMSLEAPPAKTRPRANVAIRLPRLRHDTVRSILESEKNQSFRRNLDRWCELAPGRVYIWEYGANFRNFMWPFPCLRSLAENIGYYHRIGVAGISIQGNYVSTGGDLAVLKNYVWAKLLWDSTRDVDALVDEFCRGYYGPAADDMKAYVALMENSVRGEEPISADEFDERLVYMSPELVAEAQAIFRRALAKTNGDDSDPYYRRVKEAEVGLEAWLLWKPGPLKEDGDRLIRADIGQDTAARARSLVKYCRAASPREWGTGVKYRMDFLAMHGGPMAVLRQVPVVVKVAPMQNGRLQSMLYENKIAIDTSHVSLAVPAVYYDLTTRAADRIEMQADLGVAMWGGPKQNQTGFQTIELCDDGVLLCTVSSQRLARNDGTNQATFVSTYQVAKRADEVALEFETAEGQWQAVTIDEAGETRIPQAARIKIIRPDRGVAIFDRYECPDGSVPTGTVSFDGKNRAVTVSVALPEAAVTPNARAVLGIREVTVARQP